MAISGGDGGIILTTSVDDTGLRDGLSSLKKGVSNFGKAFAVAGAAGIAAFAGITKAAADNYAQYEQLVGGVETLFKDSAGTLKKYADQAYKTAGMSANQYMESVTSFSASMISSVGGDTAKAAELSNQAMIAISDNANKMGTDVQSIVDTYLSLSRGNVAMLDNLKLGYGGTKAELKRLIEDAEEYKKSMGEIVDYDESNFADVTQAIQAIQEKLGIAGATAEEASTTIEGSAMAMKAAWENLLTGLAGSDDELSGLMDEFSDTVVTYFENLLPVVGTIIDNIPQLAIQLVDKFAQIISSNASKIGSAMADIAIVVSQAIIKLIPVAIKSGKDIIIGIAQGISGTMPVLSTAVMAIGTVFAALKITSIVSGIVSSFNAIMVVLNSYQTAVAASSSVSLLLASTLSPLQLVIGVLTGKVSLATAAQTAWNAVLNANPIMLTVTAVGLLAGAVVGAVFAYDSYLEKNSEIVVATKKIADAAEEAVEKTNELSQSLNNLSESAEENILNIEAEAYAQNELANELFNLSKKTALSADDKERMAYIVEELNNGISDLNLVLNEETGQLNMTEEAVKEVIAQKLELAKANAIQQLYTEQLKEQYKAEADAIENARKLKEAQDEYNEILSQGTVVTGRYSDTSNSTTRYTREQRIAMDNLKEAIGNYSSALETSQSAIQTSQQNMQNIATAAGVALPESFGAAKDASKTFFDNLLSQSSQASSQSAALGNDFGQGYANGINAKGAAAYAAGYNLGLQALQGTKAAQRSASPAKESKKLGNFYGQGYLNGIIEKVKDVKNAGILLVKNTIEGMKYEISEAQEIISDLLQDLIYDTRSEVQKVIDDMNEEMLESEKKYLNESLRIKKEKEEKEYNEKIENAKKQLEEDKKNAKKQLEEDKKNAKKQLEENEKNAKKQLEKSKKNAKKSEDIVKAKAEYEEKILDSKAKYEEKILNSKAKYEEKIQQIHNDKVKKEQEKANQEYLDNLKEIADKERKIYEARQKDIENAQKNIVKTYQNATDETLKIIEDLKQRQENLASKLSNFGSIMEDVYEIEDKYSDVHSFLEKRQFTSGNEYYHLNNIRIQTKELEKYYQTMINLRSRAGMPEDLFDIIKNMSFEESKDFAEKLMKMSDKQFSDYIISWKEKMEISKKMSEDLFGDEGISAKRVLSDLTDQTQVLGDYYTLLESVKKRAELPEGFFDTLRDMGIEEGLEYANALLELSDEDFANYIKAWEEKQKTSQRISKLLYKDEATQLSKEIKEKFVQLQSEFFGVGENAAIQFESGFMEQLKQAIANINNTISNAFSGVNFIGAGINFSNINIPALARGAVLPGGKPFLAMINDQPKGQTNIEAPLDTIVEAMNLSLQNNSARQTTKEEHYYLNETELMSIVYKLFKGGERLNGSSLISGGGY